MEKVFILLPGLSVKELDERIVEVNQKYPNALWAGLNRYKVLESRILGKIGKQFDILTYLDFHLIKYYHDDVMDFLARPYNKMFITDYDVLADLETFHCDKFTRITTKGAVVYSSYTRGKNPEIVDQFYNTLTATLLTLIGLGFRDFGIFGADGEGGYFGEEVSKERDGIEIGEIRRRLKEDSDFMNNYFWPLVNNIPVTSFVHIDNFSMCSSLTCFDKVPLESIL